MSEWLDVLCLWIGRAVVCSGGGALAVYLAALCFDFAIKRAGLSGAFLKFCFKEHEKSPRPFWARLLWGAKEQ